MATRRDRRGIQEQQRSAKLLGAMDPSCATELWLVRHGETDWNREHRLQGQAAPGPPLNALGRRQAAALAQALAGQRFDALYSSDLMRTVQTAEAIAQSLQVEVALAPGLRERHVGVLQGLTYEEAARQEPIAWGVLRSGANSAALPGGGESVDAMTRRVAAAIESIAAQHAGQRVLLVTHGGVLQAVHCHARGHASDRLLNGSIGVVAVQGKAWAVARWNDGAHLADAGCAAGGAGGGAGEA